MARKTKKPKLLELHSMDRDDICNEAIKYLDSLLERCTIHMVTELSGISRTTLYKWLDENITLDKMNHRDAAWFILLCETDPRFTMLLERAPLSNPRLAHRIIKGDEDNAQSTK